MESSLKAPLLLVLLLVLQYRADGSFYSIGSNSLGSKILGRSIAENDNAGAKGPGTDVESLTQITLPGVDGQSGNEPGNQAGKGNLVTNFLGSWKLASPSSKVSAMHMNLLPNNKMIMFDTSVFHISQIKNINDKCFPFTTDQGVVMQDCWAHAVEFDVVTGNLRALTMNMDPWCSSGGLDVQGRLVNTGGWKDGTRSIRYLDQCNNCDWKEYSMALARPRWYATQVTMPDGGFLLVGGRRSFSLEFVPAEGKTSTRSIKMPFLEQTTDLDENNLYPFVYLSTDGNVFIFANSRSIMFNPKTHTVIKEFPVLDGGSRNYPASASSVLLPIKLQLVNPPTIPAEVIVCGGAKPEAYKAAEKQNFMAALQDCNRLEITKPNDVWKKETMPTPRVMGDMMILPTGDLLMINGAMSGTSAWNFAESPNLTPTLYAPNSPPDKRFTQLQASNIPRMYHSTAAVLADGDVLVAGSNTNPGYIYNAKYPTEVRVERFSPPYLDPALADHRPAIDAKDLTPIWTYNAESNVKFSLKAQVQMDPTNDVSVTMYPPPFTTHGHSMNQRLLVLAVKGVVDSGGGAYTATVLSPPSNTIAPPGYYMLFVVYRGIPSVGAWVQIK